MCYMKITLACNECGSRNYQLKSDHKERLVMKKFCKNVIGIRLIKVPSEVGGYVKNGKQ